MKAQRKVENNWLFQLPEIVVKEILDIWLVVQVSTSPEPNETEDACLLVIDELENPS